MTYQSHGGVGGGGFVWTDSSRWGVDAPESPDSILVAVNYWRWLFPDEWRARTGSGDVVDLRDTVLEVALKGRELQLQGAHTTFWVLCNGQRWHLTDPYLSIVNDRWTQNRVLLPREEERWALSWARSGIPTGLCLEQVESYGFAFRDFSTDAAVSGVFEMDAFTLTRTLPPPR